MWNAAHDTYLEEKILSADPVELVCMLYQGAIDAVEEARRYLAAGEIAARSRAISKACDIVLELSSALDIQLGGQLSLRLAELYDYLLRRLLEANLKASDGLLAEAQGLLSTLTEGWRGVSPRGRSESAEPRPGPWAQLPVSEAEPVYASQCWSL
jgi:flagellar protein FliS